MAQCNAGERAKVNNNINNNNMPIRMTGHSHHHLLLRAKVVDLRTSSYNNNEDNHSRALATIDTRGDAEREARYANDAHGATAATRP